MVISTYKLHWVVAVLLAIGLLVLATGPTYAQGSPSHATPSSSAGHVVPNIGHCSGSATTCGGGCQTVSSIRSCISVNSQDKVATDAYAEGRICNVSVQLYLNSRYTGLEENYSVCYNSGTYFNGPTMNDQHNNGNNVWYTWTCATVDAGIQCASSLLQYT